MGPMDERPPTLELLEDRHDFPGPYTFKVIGAAGAGLEARVAACVAETLGTEAPPETRVRQTEAGRHESITVEPVCPNAQAVLDLYAALRQLEGVLFLF